MSSGLISLNREVYIFALLYQLRMEESKKNAYIAGVGYSFVSVFCIMIAFNIGWNLSGEFLGVFGLLFGGLGAGSFWKPESIGQIAAQMWENMQENAKEQNRHRSNKNEQKITQIVKGDAITIIGDKNTSTLKDSSKKSSKRTKK
jgi:hypothetical protein